MCHEDLQNTTLYTDIRVEVKSYLKKGMDVLMGFEITSFK